MTALMQALILAQAQPSSGGLERQAEVSSWAFSVVPIVLVLAAIVVALMVWRRQSHH